MIESLKEVSPTFEFALNSANIQRLTIFAKDGTFFC